MLLGSMALQAQEDCTACRAKGDSVPAMGIGLRLSTTLSYVLDGGGGIEANFRYPILGRHVLFDFSPGFATSHTEKVYTNWDYHSSSFFIRTGLMFTHTFGIRYVYALVHEQGDFVFEADAYDEKRIYVSDQVQMHGFEFVTALGKYISLGHSLYLDISMTGGYVRLSGNDEIPLYNLPLAGLIHQPLNTNKSNNSYYLGFHFSVYWYTPVRSLY